MVNCHNTLRRKSKGYCTRLACNIEQPCIQTASTLCISVPFIKSFIFFLFLIQVAQYLHDSEYNETANRVARSTITCSSSHDSTLVSSDYQQMTSSIECLLTLQTVKPSAHIAGKSLGASNIHFIGTYS